MIKRIILLILALHLSMAGTFAICPVGKAMSVKEIETAVNKVFNAEKPYLYIGNTLTGFVISAKDELLFDDCGNLNESGKVFLEELAKIMKDSGRKWMILCHTKVGETQVEKISRTSLRAGAITNYLTDKEKCLINQLFPIGFGSIMPTTKETLGHKALGDRVDFIIEEYNLRLE